MSELENFVDHGAPYSADGIGNEQAAPYDWGQDDPIGDVHDNIDESPYGERYIPESQYIEAIGFISAELAGRADAWNGTAPAWFPEPPEWLNLAETALEVTQVPDVDLLGTTDAVTWAKEFVKVIRSNNLVPDEDLMIGWFANAFGAQEIEDQQKLREAAENPLLYVNEEEGIVGVMTGDETLVLGDSLTIVLPTTLTGEQDVIEIGFDG